MSPSNLYANSPDIRKVRSSGMLLCSVRQVDVKIPKDRIFINAGVRTSISVTCQIFSDFPS